MVNTKLKFVITYFPEKYTVTNIDTKFRQFNPQAWKVKLIKDLEYGNATITTRACYTKL